MTKLKKSEYFSSQNCLGGIEIGKVDMDVGK